MLGKLIRYDGKMQFRFLCGIFAVCGMISVLAGAVHWLSNTFPNVVIFDIAKAFTCAVAMVAVVLMVAGMMIYSVMYFRRNLFKDEGYLMHTLPVTEPQLFVSKLLTGTLTSFVAIFAAFLCICIATLRTDYFEVVRSSLEASGVDGTYLTVVVILSLVLAIPLILCQFYASIVIGYTWRIKSGNHVNRDLLSVAAFVILYLIQQFIGMLALVVHMFVWLKPFDGYFEQRIEVFLSGDWQYAETKLLDYVNGVVSMSIISSVIIGGVLVVISIRRMKSRLDLE